MHNIKNGTVYAEFVYFALLHMCITWKGVAKKKQKKKIRLTYPISKKSVTGNIQFIFLGPRPFDI